MLNGGDGDNGCLRAATVATVLKGREVAEGVEGRRRQRLAAAVPRACSPMLARYPAPAVTVSKFRVQLTPLVIL